MQSQPRYDIVRPKSKAARQWMIEALKLGELIRRKEGLFAVVYVQESLTGDFEAHMQEVVIVKTPKSKQVPLPGFYY